MIKYILLILLLTILMYVYLKENNKKEYIIFLIFAYVIYIYISIFREIAYIPSQDKFIGGIDAYHGLILYEKANVSLNQFMMYHGEIGYKIILWLCYKISNDYKFFLYIIHTTAFLFYAKYLKNIDLECNSKYKFIFVFLITTILFSMFNTQRTDLSILIWMNAYICLKNEKYYNSIFLILISCLVHSISFIGLLIVFLYLIFKKSNYSIKTKLFLLLPIIFCFFFIISKFILPVAFSDTEYSVYLKTNNFSVMIYLYGIFLLITSVYFIQIVKKIGNYELYLLVIVVFISIMVLQINFYIAYRFVLLLLPIIYEYSIKLLNNVLNKNTITNIFFKFPLIFFLVYRIVDFFINTLPNGQII